MATIVELEGTTVVLRRRDVEFLPYDFVARWITLTAHSSLETVGLTATISVALADAGVSSNVLGTATRQPRPFCRVAAPAIVSAR